MRVTQLGVFSSISKSSLPLDRTGWPARETKTDHGNPSPVRYEFHLNRRNGEKLPESWVGRFSVPAINEMYDVDFLLPFDDRGVDVLKSDSSSEKKHRSPASKRNCCIIFPLAGFREEFSDGNGDDGGRCKTGFLRGRKVGLALTGSPDLHSTWNGIWNVDQGVHMFCGINMMASLLTGNLCFCSRVFVVSPVLYLFEELYRIVT